MSAAWGHSKSEISAWLHHQGEFLLPVLTFLSCLVFAVRLLLMCCSAWFLVFAAMLPNRPASNVCVDKTHELTSSNGWIYFRAVQHVYLLCFHFVNLLSDERRPNDLSIMVVMRWWTGLRHVYTLIVLLLMFFWGDFSLVQWKLIMNCELALYVNIIVGLHTAQWLSWRGNVIFVMHKRSHKLPCRNGCLWLTYWFQLYAAAVGLCV